LQFRDQGSGGRSLIIALVATAAVFCLLSAVLYYASVAALKHSSFRFSRIARGNLHVDVLVAGNSRARDLLSGSDPGSSPSVFNLAYNGLSREDTLEWVKNFFRQGNSAKTVVIETTALYYEHHYCDSKTYWVLYPELFADQRAACPKDASSARYFPLTLFNSEQYLRALYYLIVRTQGDQSWGDENAISERLCVRLPMENVEQFRADALRLDLRLVGAEIAELKAWLAKNAYPTQLVFVLAPFVAAPRALPAIADMQRIDEQLLGSQGNLSLASALGSDCSQFADAVHLGPAGRRKLAPLLFESLGY
jgi:hypothetical protein